MNEYEGSYAGASITESSTHVKGTVKRATLLFQHVSSKWYKDCLYKNPLRYVGNWRSEGNTISY